MSPREGSGPGRKAAEAGEAPRVLWGRVSREAVVKCSSLTCITEQMVFLSRSTVLVLNPQDNIAWRPQI